MNYDSRFRRTKIVATVGPASQHESVLGAMLDAGVNVLRINSSHGTAASRAEMMDRILAVRMAAKRSVGLLVDLQGPRIRVGELPEPRELVEGTEVVFAPEGEASGDEIPTTYERLADDVHPGARILLDDGLLEVEATEVAGRRVAGRVMHGGALNSSKGMNLPGVRVTAPAVTAKDEADIRLGVEHGADFVGLSFVRRSQDIQTLRGLLPEGLRVIAKIEKDTALDDLYGIIEAADGAMVARGDLGVELPFEEVPLAQKRVIRLANQFGRSVITATQMLESMIDRPRPTRAEASDVANAVLDGTDAVMLSAETAIGAYPVEAVEAMVRIIEETEAAELNDPTPRRRRVDRLFTKSGPDTADAIAAATCAAAEMLSAPLILCLTKSGFTARKIAAYRPSVPIVGLTTEPTTYHQLALTWGVHAALMRSRSSYDEMWTAAREYVIAQGFATAGARVVVTAGVPFDVAGTTNLLKVEVV